MSELRDLAVTANGLRHHLVEHPGGARGPVLLLHGYLDLARSFEEVIARLGARGHRVLALDFRGHGGTERCPPGAYYHFADYLADAVAVLDALEVARPHVVAHSMGATVATMLAGALPPRVRSLALLDGVGPPAMPEDVAPDRTARWLETAARVRARGPRRMASLDDAYARMRMSHPDVPEATLRVMVARSVRAADGGGWEFCFDPLHQTTSPGRFDAAAFEAYIDRVACPTLLVTGSELAGFEELARRAERYRGARRRHLEGAGHMMHWTAPDALAAHVGDFLAEVEAGDGA
jgi:pimeloyl-ACP methyl ester carboxylesterase